MNKQILISKLWYEKHVLAQGLRPFSWIYKGIIALRRYCYRIGLFKTTHFSIPLIVVGNITVGGSGKTPLVIYLAQLLKQHGYKPGIVSRGYGGKASVYPQFVTANSDPTETGDEPVLMAKRSACPVVIDPKRVNAVKKLLAETDCNVVISDDGLQHYAMGRDIEIAVIDATRGLGNHYCLPAGPLRESAERLNDVDIIVSNGQYPHADYAMQMQATTLINCRHPQIYAQANDFKGIVFHAVAGIGNPQRFFNTLQQLPLEFQAHCFADHHRFSAADFAFADDQPIIMTEKDSVKCRRFATDKMWYLPITAKINEQFDQQLLGLLVRTIISKNPA